MSLMEEQRRFFRVNTELPVGFEVLGSKEAEVALEKLHEELAHPVQHSLDDRIAMLLSELENKDPIVCELLSLLNNKLDRISTVALQAYEAEHDAECTMHHVSLSACGLALIEEDYIDSGRFILLHMQLPEKSLHIMAKVIDCQQVLNGDYRLRVEFMDLPLADEDLLIQFVMRCDAQKRRERPHIQ